jgi:hypothetical protein
VGERRLKGEGARGPHVGEPRVRELIDGIGELIEQLRAREGRGGLKGEAGGEGEGEGGGEEAGGGGDEGGAREAAGEALEGAGLKGVPMLNPRHPAPWGEGDGGAREDAGAEGGEGGAGVRVVVAREDHHLYTRLNDLRDEPVGRQEVGVERALVAEVEVKDITHEEQVRGGGPEGAAGEGAEGAEGVGVPGAAVEVQVAEEGAGAAQGEEGGGGVGAQGAVDQRGGSERSCARSALSCSRTY